MSSVKSLLCSSQVFYPLSLVLTETWHSSHVENVQSTESIHHPNSTKYSHDNLTRYVIICTSCTLTKIHQQHESSASSCDHCRNAKRRQPFCLKVKKRRARGTRMNASTFLFSEWMKTLADLWMHYAHKAPALICFAGSQCLNVTTAAMPPLYRRLDEEEMTSVWSTAA